MTETPKTGRPEHKIERVGAGGQVGEGQSGVPLHKPEGQRDAELGPRERVGAGGQVGQLEFENKK